MPTSSSTPATDARAEALHRELESVPRRPHLFNGRLLTAELLRDERSALIDDLGRLGRAVGPGVVEGLRVRKEGGSRRLVVTEGVGLNARGDRLALSAEVSFPVSVPREAEDDGPGFLPCDRDDLERLPVDAGCYLLVASPIREYAGRVPRVALHGSTAGPGAGGCGAAWEVEGLAFRLVELPKDAPCGADADLLRNRLAAWCLEALPGPLPSVSWLEEEDLPLAALFWDGSAVRVLDEWAARRTPALAGGEPRISFLLPPTRTGVGRARLLSFQAHLQELLQGPAGGSLRLRDHMRYVPPAGIVGTGHVRAGLGRLLAGIPVQERGEATLDEMVLALERSFRLSAVDLEDDVPLDLYRVGGRRKVRVGGVFYVRRVRDLLTVSVPPPEGLER